MDAVLPSRIDPFLYFALVIASHGLLDSMSSYGDPVALLAPFSWLRYKPSWMPFRGLISEMVVLWLPALLFIAFDIGGFRKRPLVSPTTAAA